MMATKIDQLYDSLQRFIDRKHNMRIPPQQDDDDVVIANAFDELEKLREENKRLKEENNDLKYLLAEEGIAWKRCTRNDMQGGEDK